MWNKVKVSGTARKAANGDFIEIRTADIFLETPIKHIKKSLKLIADVVRQGIFLCGGSNLIRDFF